MEEDDSNEWIKNISEEELEEIENVENIKEPEYKEEIENVEDVVDIENVEINIERATNMEETPFQYHYEHEYYEKYFGKILNNKKKKINTKFNYW